jgi:hypothetical protein
MASSAVQSSAVEIVGEGVISTEESQTFPSEDPITGDLWFSVIGRSFDAQTIMVARRTDSGWARESGVTVLPASLPTAHLCI